jgi:hypothetical protein
MNGQVPNAFAVASFNGPFFLPSLLFWIVSRAWTTKNMLDIVGCPCGPGIELRVLRIVSLRSLPDRTLEAGVVGACEDSAAWKPFASGVVGTFLPLSTLITGKMERKRKNIKDNGTERRTFC